MSNGTLYYRSAFTTDPNGGNPAGVWVGDALPPAEEMQRIAAEVGYSETAFIAPQEGANRTIRYFSPEIEVPFCGHATIATGVVLGELSGDDTYLLQTQAGEVPVAVRSQAGGRESALTSVEPSYKDVSAALIEEVLSALNWELADLDNKIPVALAFAGAWHMVIAVKTLERLNQLDYDFETLKATMNREGLTTIQLIWREDDDTIHSRNPFPVGGVVEDPATGAAAAALGGYLREAKLVEAPKTVLIRQGEAMGRPSRLTVEIPESGGIVVRGTAVAISR
ncbi:MAG: PhzF family phenazine biosynthesis protein [Chloroflexota bacterium]